MVLPRENAVYMVPRTLQKLGGNSPFVPTAAFASASSRFGVTLFPMLGSQTLLSIGKDVPLIFIPFVFT